MANKQQYEYRKTNHLCVYCETPVPVGLTCDKCKAKVKSYAEARKNQFASGGKKTAKQVEEPAVEFNGEVKEITSLNEVPKDHWLLEETSLDALVSSHTRKIGTPPSFVYKFKRTMGALWIAVVGKVKG
jgi:hypothetical protein